MFIISAAIFSAAKIMNSDETARLISRKNEAYPEKIPLY